MRECVCASIRERDRQDNVNMRGGEPGLASLTGLAAPLLARGKGVLDIARTTAWTFVGHLLDTSVDILENPGIAHEERCTEQARGAVERTHKCAGFPSFVLSWDRPLCTENAEARSDAEHIASAASPVLQAEQGNLHRAVRTIHR